MSGFLAMNGYTGYLLVAYGVTAVVLIGNVIAANHQFGRTHLRLREHLERRAGRRPVPGEPGTAKVGGTGGKEAAVGRSS